MFLPSKPSPHYAFWIIAAISLAMSLVETRAAVIVESFDTYPGSASNYGWSNAWSNGGSNVNAATSDLSPINGGGRYLVVTSTDTGDTGIRRSIDSAVLDTATTAHTISWDVRFDALTDINSYADRIHFMANRAGALGSNNTASWLVGMVGGNNSGTGDYFPGVWYFYDNQSTTSSGTFSGDDMINTGMTVVQGHTYHFIIEVDPIAQTYNATVIDMTANTSFTSTGLNFRDQTDGQQHQYLVFGGTISNSSDQRAFAIDNLVIAVPEPGRFLLLVSALVPLLTRRRRPALRD